MTEFPVKKATVCRVAVFSNEVLRQIYFLGVYEMFIMTNSSNMDC